MSEKSKEALRREVVKAIHSLRQFSTADVIRAHPIARAAFDRYDEAIRAEHPSETLYRFDGRVPPERPSFDGDSLNEQAVRLHDDRVRPLLLIYAEKRDAAEWDYDDAEQALAGLFALLDAKDVAMERLRVQCAQLTDRSEFDKADICILRRERDEALTKLERAEQALAERDAAMVGIRLRADEWKGTGNCCASTANYVAEPARPFLKPTEAVDPLVAIFTEIARGPNRPSNEEEEAAAFRQALARSGYEVRKVGESSDAE